MSEPIVMPNEGDQRTEYGIKWTWRNGSVSYALDGSSRVYLDALLGEATLDGIERGELVQATITRSPWTPVLPLGVLRLDQVAAEEYGGIKVAELGDGVVAGYNVVAFTDDPVKAVAAVRAHFLMVHNETPQLTPRWEDEPVRWWQVYDTCGCGATCPHAADEDHDCAHWGLPPCRWEEDVAAWIGEVSEKDAPGALPFVEFEVSDSFTADDWTRLLQLRLGDAERHLRTLAKKCVTVRPTLDKPYPDAPETTPWKQFVEQPAREAYDLAVEIRRELKARGVTS